jgi:hypothetical protein
MLPGTGQHTHHLDTSKSFQQKHNDSGIELEFRVSKKVHSTSEPWLLISSLRLFKKKDKVQTIFGVQTGKLWKTLGAGHCAATKKIAAKLVAASGWPPS